MAEALDGLFAGHHADDSLGDLAILAVEPAPDSSRLLVTVASRPGGPPPDPARILEQIDRASGWLRSEVARSICRKRAPMLAHRALTIAGATEPGPS